MMNPGKRDEMMLSSPLFAVIKRELNRIAGKWILLFATLFGPVAAFLLVSWMFSSAVVRDLPVTVVDKDQTQLSRKITRMIDALPACQVVRQSCSIADARAEMMKGENDAVVYLPEGLEESVQRGRPAVLALYLNNTNVVKGGVLQSNLVSALSTCSGAVKLESMVRKGSPPGIARQRVQPVRPDVHLMFNPYGNYAYFLMLGLLPLLAVVFIFLGSSYAIGIEMKEGTAGEWIRTAGHSTTIALIGKLIPYVALFFADLMFMNILLIRVMGTPLNGSPALLFIAEFLLILAYQAMAIVVLTITLNLRLTLSLGTAYTMMALTFSGLTFPAMGMPLMAKMFSFVFPYTFWLKVFMSQTLRGEPVREAIVPLLLLLPFILTGVVALPLFGKRLGDKRWRTKE